MRQFFVALTFVAELKIIDFMHTTKRNLRVVIGLAVIGLFLGQAFFAVAATTAPSVSPAKSTLKVATRQVAAKVGKKARSVHKNSSMSGIASIYADSLSGRKTASGQRFNQKKLTAAHRSLPIGTRVLVTNLHNNKTVEVFINDRGPFHRDRIIDLSSAAASKLGMRKRGFAQVKLEIIKG